MADEGDQTDSAAISMAGVHKWFGSFHVLRNINLEVRRGDHSGAGFQSDSAGHSAGKSRRRSDDRL